MASLPDTPPRPAVTRSHPAHDLKFLARALMVTGQLPILSAETIDHVRRCPQRVAVAPTAASGA